MRNDSSKSCAIRYAAGGASGIVEVLATHPLDYLKTMRQAGHPLPTPLHNHLYRGLMPRVLGVVPMRMTFWGVQDHAYSTLCGAGHLPPVACAVSAGVVAGACQTIIDAPIERMKIRRMLAQANALGFAATLYRNTAFSACMVTLNAADVPEELSTAQPAVAGLLASVATQPLDYAKTMIQSAPAGSRSQSVAQILRTTLRESPGRLFVGGIYRALVSSVSMGVGFTVFSYLSDTFEQRC